MKYNDNKKENKSNTIQDLINTVSSLHQDNKKRKWGLLLFIWKKHFPETAQYIASFYGKEKKLYIGFLSSILVHEYRLKKNKVITIINKNFFEKEGEVDFIENIIFFIA